ncbi:MAG: CBS domain-containing protein [Gemmatimonadales bacterium]|jgi:CBS-domain-containing membrane protein|nr:CBS domain-containing protein [Gemmatimonadales bacterium]MBT3498540.1 CBS domain-containing protein [Gemmatimonadales bacterium]MBT3776313.1 CBS domain-containing protein [Gemmatimonadales bacterium]MBT3958929.1 CBS domain-containing protein [Gemmatimonadales bacterium]MBT4188779.1 CBS domain-containing protein [Gemmatimonadales bacterium]
MHGDVVPVTPGTSARCFARLLVDQEIRGLPVVDGNTKLVGAVSQTDLVRLAAEESNVHLTTSARRTNVERV